MNTAREFTVRLQELLRRERLALTDFLVALAEFDRERLWVELGYTSLFYFLHRRRRSRSRVPRLLMLVNWLASQPILRGSRRRHWRRAACEIRWNR